MGRSIVSSGVFTSFRICFILNLHMCKHVMTSKVSLLKYHIIGFPCRKYGRADSLGSFWLALWLAARRLFCLWARFPRTWIAFQRHHRQMPISSLRRPTFMLPSSGSDRYIPLPRIFNVFCLQGSITGMPCALCRHGSVFNKRHADWKFDYAHFAESSGRPIPIIIIWNRGYTGHAFKQSSE